MRGAPARFPNEPWSLSPTSSISCIEALVTLTIPAPVMQWCTRARQPIPSRCLGVRRRLLLRALPHERIVPEQVCSPHASAVLLAVVLPPTAPFFCSLPAGGQRGRFLVRQAPLQGNISRESIRRQEQLSFITWVHFRPGCAHPSRTPAPRKALNA